MVHGPRWGTDRWGQPFGQRPHYRELLGGGGPVDAATTSDDAASSEPRTLTSSRPRWRRWDRSPRGCGRRRRTPYDAEAARKATSGRPGGGFRRWTCARRVALRSIATLPTCCDTTSSPPLARRQTPAHDARGAPMTTPTTCTDPLADLAAASVAVWLDDLSRERLRSGNPDAVTHRSCFHSRVGNGRGGLGRMRHHPVSRPRSSNRTCGFPASGFPTGFISRHTVGRQHGHGVAEARRARRTLPHRDSAWCRATAPCDAGPGSDGPGRRRDCRPPDRP